jgi:hypothetical protein
MVSSKVSNEPDLTIDWILFRLSSTEPEPEPEPEPEIEPNKSFEQLWLGAAVVIVVSGS